MEDAPSEPRTAGLARARLYIDRTSAGSGRGTGAVRDTRRVFGTKATMADSHAGHIDAIWTSEAAARQHALRRSSHPGVRDVAVTAFTLDELGTWYPLVWYRHGREDVNDRPFPTGVHG